MPSKDSLEYSTLPKPKSKPSVDLEDHIAKNDIGDAIYDYSTESFIDINKGYLQGKPNAELDKLFEAQGDYYGKTYRGTHIDSNKLAQLEEGMIINNKMPLSSSKEREGVEMYILNKDTTRKNTEKVIFEIDNNRVPQYDISPYAELDEAEVLVSPKSNLHVQDIRKEDGVTIIEVGHIHPDLQEVMAGKAKAVTNIMSLTGGMILADDILNKEQQ